MCCTIHDNSIYSIHFFQRLTEKQFSGSKFILSEFWHGSRRFGESGSRVLTTRKLKSIFTKSFLLITFAQCYGSMIFWCGSRSADPCLLLMDSDSSIFIIDLQDAYFFLKVFLHHFSKKKKSKRSHKTVEIKVFLTNFCLMIEVSGSGSIPLTNGSVSGFRMPKNIWIRWIRISKINS